MKNMVSSIVVIGSLIVLMRYQAIKGKPGGNVGQPRIRTGEHEGFVLDTLVSPVSIPGCPTSEPSFPFIICQK